MIIVLVTICHETPTKSLFGGAPAAPTLGTITVLWRSRRSPKSRASVARAACMLFLLEASSLLAPCYMTTTGLNRKELEP